MSSSSSSVLLLQFDSEYKDSDKDWNKVNTNEKEATNEQQLEKNSGTLFHFILFRAAHQCIHNVFSATPPLSRYYLAMVVVNENEQLSEHGRHDVKY